MRKVILYIRPYDCDFFYKEAEYLHKEAEEYGEDNFVYDIDPDFGDNIAKVTIAEPEMWVEVRDEWIEFKYSHVLNDYDIHTTTILSMEIEF